MMDQGQTRYPFALVTEIDGYLIWIDCPTLMDIDIGIHEITNKIQTKNLNFILGSETYHKVIGSKKSEEQFTIVGNC